MRIPTLISKCEKCRFFFLHADLDGINSGCRKPEGVIVDCFGTLEERLKEEGEAGNEEVFQPPAPVAD